jgi:hypothetical protein
MVVLCGGGLLWAAVCLARALPSTLTIRGEVLDEKNAPIAEAPCTLTSRLLPTEGLTVSTDYKGLFEFSGLQPGEYTLLCAASGHQPLKRTMELTDEPPPDLQLVLPPLVVMHQTVEVREQAESVATAPSPASSKLGETQLASLPLVEQKFKAVLPYLPGVVRTPDGRINIKGVPDSQGQLLVNSAEAADPVTGNLAIDVPVVAIDSLQVYKNTYDAQYGGFTGGLTTIHTRPPSQKWEFEVQNLPPNPRIKNGSLVGIADYNPRLYLTGPLITDRLSFSESLGYDIDKQPVRGLAWPHNEIWTHDFNSFTDLHYVFSSHHLATITSNVFPLRRQFADINSLVPLAASSDYGQHGFKITLTDQFITDSGGIFTTMLDGMQFYTWGHGEGGANMLVTPNGWGGNFFNAYQRNSEQEQFSETYKLPRLKWWGKHEWTTGVGFLNRMFEGRTRSRTVDLLRPDGTLTEQVNFLGPGALAARDFEGSFFVSDHWVPNDHLSLDLGVRYAGQTLGRAANVAPRFGFAFSPGQSGKTVLRGGVGRFFGHTPLLAGDFTSYPARQLSYFDESNDLIGAPITYVSAYGGLSPQGGLTAFQTFPGTVPYNWTWSLEADRELLPRVTLRLSYISSRAYDQYIVDPVSDLSTGPAMLLTPHGSSRYHELESTVHIRLRGKTAWNFSYVYSKARGDLNTLAQLFVPFEEPVIRNDVYSNLGSDVPNRILSWGIFKTHVWGIEAGPVADFHSGFPYSSLDMQQNYFGIPNSQRFPRFFSLDTKLSKEFHLPFPMIKKHLMRGSLTIFNLSDHYNPRDVFDNNSSPYYRHFVGNQHRFLDSALDVLY